MKTKPALSRSMAEEIISVLWLIAALLAWQSEIFWLAIALFIKAASDTACAIIFALAEIRAEREKP